MRSSKAAGTPTRLSTCRQAPSGDKLRTVQSSTDRLSLNNILPPRSVRLRRDARRSSMASSRQREIAQLALSHPLVVEGLTAAPQFEAMTSAIGRRDPRLCFPRLGARLGRRPIELAGREAMRAAVLTEVNKPLQILDLEQEPPKANEVRVQV